MVNKAAEQYANNKVLTASPAELTLMLYDGAVKFCNIALMGLEKNDYEYAFKMAMAAGGASTGSENLATKQEVEDIFMNVDTVSLNI